MTTALQEKPFNLHTSLTLPGALQQIDALQILRAVAVILVAWLHAGLTLGEGRLPHFGAFGIDIFFVISGFIISAVVLRTKQAPGLRAMWAFLKRRLIRIFPIYWFFCVLASARLIHGHGFKLATYFPGYFLLPNLYPQHPLVVGFSWTMIFEMFFYYSLAAALLVTVKHAVLLSISAFSVLVLVGHFVGIHRPTWIIVANPMLLEFILGAILALTFARSGQKKKLGICMLALGIAGSLYIRAHPLQGGAAGIDMVLASVQVMRRVLTWGISAALIVGGVIFWSPSTHSFVGKIAVVLGNASYSTYLASSLLIELAVRLLTKPGAYLSLPRLALAQSLVVIFVMFGGWAFYQFVEWPMLRWLRAKLQ
jgi:exopolysaccharide production protein ExoZ